MNVYVKTGKNLVGMVLTGNHNKVYYYKAFETRTQDKESQIVLATQRAVSYIETNKPLDISDTINIYSDIPVNMEKLENDEYLKRHHFKFKEKQVEDEKEKQRMLLASVEIEMEYRRRDIRGAKLER